MNIPLPPSAFPIGNKATAAATFVVAVLVGLSLYLSVQSKPQPPFNR